MGPRRQRLAATRATRRRERVAEASGALGRAGSGQRQAAVWAVRSRAEREASWAEVGPREGRGRNGPQEREKETWAALGRAWGVGAGLGREERVGLGSGLLGFGSWVSFLFYFLFFSFSKSISNKV